MLTIDECKNYIGDLNLTDEKIEEVRDLLYASVEQALDYVIEQGIVSDEETICQPTAKTK